MVQPVQRVNIMVVIIAATIALGTMFIILCEVGFLVAIHRVSVFLRRLLGH